VLCVPLHNNFFYFIMSTTGFEALPPRAEGRAAKRRRRDEPAAAAAAASASPPPSAAAAAAAPPCAPPAAHVPGCGAGGGYEYLDHTADVQIHAWGPSLGDAFAQAALGMFGYMTEPDGIAISAAPGGARFVDATGHDAVTLLFNFLDACLYAFASDDFVARDMRVVEFCAGAGGGGYSIRAAAYGERFELGRHAQGTEVKAITYSNMQIITPQGTVTANDAGTVAGGATAGARAGAGDRRAPYELFVIVDI